MLMKIFLSLLLIILPIIGIADSSFITYEKFANIIPDCGVGFDCGTVLNSQWANIGPIPLSLLGLLFYTIVFILAVMNYLEYDVRKIIIPFTKKVGIKKESILNLVTTQELLLAITIFGALFSFYLIFLMGVVIQAWCKYCLISALTSFFLFIISSIYYLSSQKNSPFMLKNVTLLTIHFLYTKILKRIFFIFDAEFVHDQLIKIGNTLGSLKFTKFLTSISFSFSHQVIEKTIDGINFKNPVGLSAGFDYNGDLTGILPSVGFGFHTIGTVTFYPYEGNKKPRLGRFLKSKSLLVNKGLKSLGATEVINKLSNIKFSIPTGISIASTNMFFESEKEQIEDILKTFVQFEKSTINHSYYELNISCPNTFGGEPFTSPDRLKTLLIALSKLKISKPVYIKMPIDQSKKDTLLMLEVINKFKIAGVIFGNLTKDKTNPDIDPIDRKKWQFIKGNLSGKPTWNRSNELIKFTKRNFKNRFTIIGTGGIFSGKDAIEKMTLGADLVQIITGMIFEGPEVLGMINIKLAQKALNKSTKRIGHKSRN